MFLRRWASSTMSMAQVTAPRNDWKENQHDTISLKHYIRFSIYLTPKVSCNLYKMSKKENYDLQYKRKLYP